MSLTLFYFILGNFIEVIGTRIVSVNHLPIAIKVIRENIVIINSQMKNIIWNQPGNLCRDWLIPANVTGENAYPSIDCWAKQKFAIGFFRHLFKNFLN